MSAMALTGVFALEELSARFGSVTPVGGLTVAVLVREIVAPALTVPAMVMVTLPPLGRVGTVPVTLLPEIETEAGQTAPPEALLQLAVSPLIADTTGSLKLALSALLGPALLITKL